MPSDIAVDDSTREAVEALQAKLGDNEDAAILLAIIVASWNQVALLYEESQRRHDISVGGAASFLSGLGDAMVQLGGDVEAGERELIELHTKVVDKLVLASGDIQRVRSIMKDVLTEYNEFEGTVDALKGGLGSLVQATLTSLNPAIARIALPMVGRVFGTSD